MIWQNTQSLTRGIVPCRVRRNGAPILRGVTSDAVPPEYAVRLARPGEEPAICAVCRAGFALSSQGLLSPATIERQADLYYDPARVRGEIESAGNAASWQGYVVAVTPAGQVLGAAGGGVTEGDAGQVYVLFLDPDLRGLGIGTALLAHVTDQQRALGATKQWVSVTEGNDLGVPFYRHAGFVVRDRAPFPSGDGATAEWHSLRMSRRI